MKTLTTALTLAAALTAGLVTAPPATADLIGASFRHYSPDNGYDNPIRIHFHGVSGVYYLREGEHSDHLQPNGSEDVDWILLASNEELTCKQNANGQESWRVKYRGDGGRIYVDDLVNDVCVIGTAD